MSADPKIVTNNYSFPTGMGLPYLTFGLGAFLRASELYGFWWGLNYGLLWPVWLGYEVAKILLH